jgi:HK97 family phage major capsid protein
MIFKEHLALQERHRHLEAMRSIVDKAEAAKRTLSRRENAELRSLEAHVETLDEQIETHRSGGNPSAQSGDSDKFGSARTRAIRHGIGRPADGEAIGLTRGQSMQAWAEQRNGNYGLGGDGLDGGGETEMNLGAIVRAMVTGQRDGMNDAEKRAMSEGVNSAGGFVTPEVLSARLIDRVRNVGRIFQAGATVVPLASDTVNLARLVTGVAPSWKTEGNPIGAQDMVFDRITFKPQTLPVQVLLSQELFDDMSDGAHAMIESEIAQAIALELDRAALYGTGVAPQPLGIKGQPGVTLTAFGGANGATPANYDWALDGIQTLRGANFDPDGFVFAPRTQRTLDGLKDSQLRYLDPPPSYKDVTKYTTNQVPTNLTVGTSAGVCSDVFVGKWSELLIGVRPTLGLRVKVLTERYADNLQVAIIAWLRADVQLAHAAAFNVISGVKP